MIIYPGYMTSPAPAEDDMWAKWKPVREDMDQFPPMAMRGPRMNEAVNAFVRYTAEPKGVNIWKLPSETWSSKQGDCKDYASLKYAILLKDGVPEDDLMVVIGTLWIGLKKYGDDHAWLLACGQVYDNKFDQLIQPDSYLNFIPKKGVTGNRVVLFSKGFVMADVLANHKPVMPG